LNKLDEILNKKNLDIEIQNDRAINEEWMNVIKVKSDKMNDFIIDKDCKEEHNIIDHDENNKIKCKKLINSIFNFENLHPSIKKLIIQYESMIKTSRPIYDPT